MLLCATSDCDVLPSSSDVFGGAKAAGGRSVGEQAEREPPRVALAEHERQPEPADAVDDVDRIDVADPHRP